MSLIIGLNAFHPDSAACALVDGKLVAAAAEERFGPRIKHVAGFPTHALQAVLRSIGASLRDVDYLALGNDHRSNLSAKLARVAAAPLHSARAVLTHLQRRAAARSLSQLAADACRVRLRDCSFRVVRVEHHLAHIASAYFTSPFDLAAGFSCDGAGDFTSAMFARCQANRIHVLQRVHVPHSLGFFYTALCQFIGFDRFGEEYKVMGLAASGQPAYRDLMRQLLRPTADGRFRLNLDFFQPLRKNLIDCVAPNGETLLPPLYSHQLVKRLGPPRHRDAPITRRDQDLAASCQAHFEEILLHSLRALHRRVPSDNLVSAGGCALNGLANARILRDTPFRHASLHSAAADDGTAVGAALYLWNQLLRRPRAEPVLHPYLGPEHSVADMHAALSAAGLPCRPLDSPALLARAADLLHAGRILGWYQGRSEWGPRALGNRSILAHPGHPGIKDLLNSKIKRREPFRPFAPSILAEAAPDYFQQPVPSPFMMHVVKIHPHRRAALSAVCHLDGTGRLHTVTRAQNPLYYDLIKTFADRTGTPALLNTSFNENEPVVDTPGQAVDCFLRTGMDALCLGPFLVERNHGA